MTSDATKAVLLGAYLLGALIWAVYFGSLHLGSRADPIHYQDGTTRWSARGVLLTPLWPAVAVIAGAIGAGKWVGQLMVDATKEES